MNVLETKFCFNLKQYTTNKIKSSVLNTIYFYLEDDDHQGVISNGETFLFTLQFIQNLNYLMSFQKIKSGSFCVGGRHRSATKTFLVI